jgi:hypothetical protein
MKRFKFLNENPRGCLLKVVNLPGEVTIQECLNARIWIPNLEEI